MSASSDAGPLIWLAKIDTLHLLKHYHPEVLIPPAVYRETVIHGIEKKHPDAQHIQKAINEKWISIHTPASDIVEQVKTTEQQQYINLGEGERQAIALAIERQVVFLTDDEDAHKVGKIHGLDPKGVLYLLLRSVKDHQISKTVVKEKLRQMIEEGFWLNPIVIHRFHETLDQL